MNATLQRNLLLGAVAALAIGAITVWWLYTFERKDVEIPLPPRGEAAYNPLYALKRALQEDGVRVASHRRLSLRALSLQPRDTLWLLGDLRTLSAREAGELEAWIGSGGHLIAAAPSLGWREDARVDEGPLLRALGVSLARTEDGECRAFRGRDALPKDESWIRLCSSVQLSADDEARVSLRWRDAAPHGASPDEGLRRDYLMRLSSGAGSLDLVTDLDFATNPRLEDPGAAALARQLLAPNYGRGTVHLIYDADMPPLWKLLLERAWMAWLPLLLATLGWLWWRTQRRGPLLPSPLPMRRALIEHVQASGEHVHRYGRGHLLHASLRALFDARLRRRDPYAASLEGQAQRAAIAARTGLTEAEVEAALRAPVPFVAADLRLRIARLNRLKARL